MTRKFSRRRALAILSLGTIAPQSISAIAREPAERQAAPGSMYRLEFSFPDDELIGDLLHGERGDPHAQASVPHREWYSESIRRQFGGWGPKPRIYPRVEGFAARPIEWKRERVIATAARFLGYGYQHHHVPDWDPPASWPWKKTCVGHNGKGVDCSNFTSFVYNQGCGLHLNSAVGHQSELKHAAIAVGESAPLARIELPRDYAERQKALHTGDLVYVRGREGGPVTHVILWIGSVGRSPGDVPMILDSHGAGVEDEDGRAIPCGIHVRPFRERSWYNRCAAHALRVFH